MGFKEEFKKLVKEAALTKFAGDTDLARKANVPQSAVSMLNNNKRSGLQLDTVGKLLDAIGAKIVLAPEDHVSGDKQVSSLPDDLTLLPVYAAAGAASEDQEQSPKFHIAVPRQYVRPNLDTLQIEGNSMEPTILDKAVVGVNLDSGDIVQGKIYAVRLPYEGIVVKRLFLDHEKRLFVLRSDNKNGDYPDIKISFDDSAAFIHGLVVWVLQSYEKIVI